MPEITGWYFASIGPKKEMFGAIYETLYFILTVIIIGIILSFVIGLLIARSIVKPLNVVANDFNNFAQKLQDIIRDIKSSKEDLLTVGTGMDEMEIGAKNINKTGSELSEMNDSLHLAIEQINNQIEQFSV